MSNFIGDGIFGLFMLILGLVLGLMTGCDLGRSRCQREAVQVGAAHWVADDAGRPRFEWKGVTP